MEAPALPLRDIEISASRKVAEEERRGDRGRGEGAKTSVMAKGGVRDAAPPPAPSSAMAAEPYISADSRDL